MLSAKSGMPGSWGKENPKSENDQPSYAEEQEVSEHGENLAAGIVGKTGEVVDETGKTVGKITEGVPQDLIGNVVTATGDIIGKDGGIVGKALPLGELTEGLTNPKDTEGGGGGLFGVMGAAKGVKGVVDTVDGTVKTVNRTLPLVGDLTKGLGLGGLAASEKADDDNKTQSDGQVLPLFSDKPSEPEEKEQLTEDAKRDLFEVNDQTSEVAPIDLKDVDDQQVNGEVAPIDLKDVDDQQVNGKLTDDNTPAKSDIVSDKGLTEIDNPEDLKVEDEVPEPETLQDQPADDKTADVTKTDVVEDVKDKADDKTKDVKDTTQDKTTDVKDVAEDKTEDIKDAVEDKAQDVKEDAKDTKDTVEDKLADTKDKVGTTDETEDKLKDVQEEGKDEIENVKDQTVKDGEDGPVTVEGGLLRAPFEKFPGAEINDEGKVIYDDETVGKLVEGDHEDLAGKQVDAEGNILNERGSIVGKAELKSELAEELAKEAEAAVDFTILKGAKVNKAGNLVNDKGEAIGRVVSGILKHLIGRKADENGEIWNDNGKVIGKAEPIPETEREELREPSPFEDFPGATVESNGHVLYNGEIVGRVIEGDAKALKGKKVDDDGDILDRSGNVIGKAERWEPEPEAEPEPEPEVDKSILAGKRVNKAGNVVDSNGQIFGRVIEGDIKRLVGRMCDKNGNIRSESGDILGKAELVPEGEREGFKDGPFAELPGCTVSKEGKVVTPSGDVVGRLVSGDARVLFGRAVDEDGDILDRNGNTIGKAERWEEPEVPVVEKKKGPMAGRKVNRKGEVVDEDGNLIGKLTTGELSICSGKEIDDDGDVVDSKGRTIGHVSLIEDIPEPPKVEEESPEDKKAREDAETDKKLAKQLAACVEQCLDKIRPICKMITAKIEKAERTPKDELDEEELVKQVKPLIEEGGKILNEANGTIRALDPDGRIQRNAKHKSATRDATPEEYHLADVLKELTGTVTECIDGAKRKIEDMPHAKKELNPLWGLLTEPLFQILAAVGLLLTGVLNIVGRLLSGLGLGGLVDGLLGTLGLNRLLDGLGLGSLVGALTGKKDKKK